MGNEAIKTRRIKSNDGESGLILKVFRRFGKFRFTVQFGDGLSGFADTLVPFLKSGYVFLTLEEAEREAELAICDYFDAE